MIRDIKYIWYGMSYSELRDALKGGMKLRSFPLVDRPDKMVLLGSIQRTELINAIQRQIGKERRTQEAMRRHQQDVSEHQSLLKQDTLNLMSGIMSSAPEQRPSIFDNLSIDPLILQQLNSKPNTSILKKSSSYSINPSDTPMKQVYPTVTSAEPTWKLALDNLQNIFRRADQR